MKKVLHIINGEHFAGAERVQDLLALGLPEHGYECEFVCLKIGEFSSQRSSKVPLKTILMKHKLDFSVVSKIVKHAKARSIEIIHTHSARNVLIGKFVSNALKLPLVHHVHSPALRDTENKFRNWLNGLAEDNFALKSATKLIPVSKSLQNYLEDKGIRADKITTVPNGVPIYRSEAVWTAPTEGQPWVLGVVALFRPRKGLEVLLNSLKLILDNGHNVRLKIVGSFESPDYEIKIKQTCEALGILAAIDFIGFTSDVYAQLEKMHIFVLPSLYGEGLPMVVIEAMSVGVPVVSTNVEGIPSVIEHDDSGKIAEPNDSYSLFQCIEDLILKPSLANTISHNGFERHKNYFSTKAMVKGVASVYNSLY